MIAIRRAEPGDAQALVELAREVSGEEGAWLLTTSAWRSVADERRYLRAVRRHPDAAVYVAEDGEPGSSDGSPWPATFILRAATSPISA